MKSGNPKSRSLSPSQADSGPLFHGTRQSKAPAPEQPPPRSRKASNPKALAPSGDGESQWLQVKSQLEDEIERCRDSENQLRLILDIIRAVTTADDLISAVQAVLERICRAIGWVCGEAWMPAGSEGNLHLSPAWWAVENPSLVRFQKASRQIVMEPNTGMVGKVFHAKKSLWINRLESSPRFVRRDLARRAGIRSAFAVPVVWNGKVMAVLAFFSECREPENKRLVEMIELVAAQLGGLIQRKQTEEEISRHKDQLAQAQQMAHLGSWEWKIQENQVSWSANLYNLFGLSPEQFTPSVTGYLGFVHPEDRAAKETFIRQAVLRKTGFQQEIRIVRADGVERRVHTEARYLQNHKGTEILVGICRDITEERQSEQAVRQLVSIIQASDDAIFGKDLNGKIFSWNPGAERIFGYTAEEMIGQSVAELIPQERRGELKQIMKQIRNGHSVTQFETIRRHKDGSLVPIQLTISPICRADGTPVSASVISRDITKLKHLEALVLEISEREQRRIGQDIHDGLSQQLSAVTYLAHLVAKRLRGRGLNEADEVGRIIDLLNEAGRHASTLARGLSPVRPGSDSLVSALERLTSSLEQTYQISSWFTTNAIINISDTNVATHLYRIAQEAVNNALKHGRATEIVIHLDVRNSHLEMVVSDNGCGIPKRNLLHRGIGMDSMQFRAHTVGGTLDFKRRRPHGTRVCCRLPLPSPVVRVENNPHN